MSKLTLSVVSMTTVLGLSPLFSIAQAGTVHHAHISCEGILASVSAIDSGPGVEAEIACLSRCAEEGCPEENMAALKNEPVDYVELVCRTKDSAIIDLANLLVVAGGGKAPVMLDARAQHGFRHKGYRCTKLAVDLRKIKEQF